MTTFDSPSGSKLLPSARRAKNVRNLQRITTQINNMLLRGQFTRNGARNQQCSYVLRTKIMRNPTLWQCFLQFPQFPNPPTTVFPALFTGCDASSAESSGNSTIGPLQIGSKTLQICFHNQSINQSITRSNEHMQ